MMAVDAMHTMRAGQPVEQGSVLLHVGIHKTGTTALQVALNDSRAVLREHGVNYPGTRTYHHKAILAGANRPYGWRENGAKVPPKRHWNKMLREADYEGRTIISSEFLDDISAQTAAKVIEDLGGPQRVHVAVTLRAIGSILPSAWQQHVKSGMSMSYESWLDVILNDPDSSRSTRFWYRHDQVVQVQRWCDIVGPERVHVVVIPDGDRTAIFTAFETLLDLPEGLLSGGESQVLNRSMTAAEAEFVRRLNKNLVGTMNWDEFSGLVRRGLVLNMVEKRRPASGEARLETPAWAADRAAEIGAGFAEGLSTLDVDVIGDLSDLGMRARSGETVQPDTIAMDVVVAATVGLVEEALAEQRVLASQLAELTATPAEVTTPRSRWNARRMARVLKARVKG